MSQIHGRFTDRQVKVLFQGYCQGQLRRTDLLDLLGSGGNNPYQYCRLMVRLGQRSPAGVSRQMTALLGTPASF